MGKGYKWTLLSILATSTFLTACGSSNNEKNINGNDNVNTNSSTNNVVKTDKTDNQNSEDNEGLNNMQDVRVKLTCNNEKVIVKLYDNPTSRDFFDQLPLTVTFKDYANIEKISVLDQRLTTKDAPSGSDPSVGDFAYFSPWGNITLFYGYHGLSNGLIKLGKIESGVEKLKSINDDFKVTIENLD
ncbi:cyclophilin-like fold protein [Peribacillus simplex]|uniref:cyclophilin-like fold protein n=1 Tax=Peribacillus simplex TaxID=1478 RepID=UPI003D269F44